MSHLFKPEQNYLSLKSAWNVSLPLNPNKTNYYYERCGICFTPQIQTKLIIVKEDVTYAPPLKT